MIRSDAVVDRMRWMSALGLAALLALTVGFALRTAGGLSVPTPISLAPPSPALGPATALDPRIARLAALHPGRVVEAIIQFKAGVTAERARWAVRRAGGRVFGELHIINALAVKLSAADARKLATSHDVHAISLNSTIRTEGRPGSLSAANLQSTYDQTLKVTQLWQRGIDGAGVGVAVIDTGIAGEQPDVQTPDHR